MKLLLQLLALMLIFNAVYISIYKLYSFLSPKLKYLFYKYILRKSMPEPIMYSDLEQSIYEEEDKNSKFHGILFWNLWMILLWALTPIDTIRFYVGFMAGLTLYFVGYRESFKNHMIYIKYRNINQQKINDELEILERKFTPLTRTEHDA